MAVKSTFTPKASLTDAPTNLKEAIDWVLRVTGRDGKENRDECICGLAAAVTDLLQSVELEYHGYQGDVKDGSAETNKGASPKEVTDRLNGLFSLVQGLGGTAVVRTYIDQLAQVLSALVGWSRIEKCGKGGWNGTCTKGTKEHHGLDGCQYLVEIKPENKCDTCGCMKWDVSEANQNDKGHHLGRGCTRCKDNGGRDACQCSTPGSGCSAGEECKCAKKGKCCKCCCNGGQCKCGDVKDRKCSCVKEDIYGLGLYGHNDSYRSVYSKNNRPPTWNDLNESAPKHYQCAQILLGSVCLIWSGITYMYWTGKWAKGSPRWNNHILDGNGLDDGTLSQWLQALGFPREMLNNSGPKNRLDKVIWDGFRDKFLLGFVEPKGLSDSGEVNDQNGNTARNPFNMNYAGFVHTIHRDSFHEGATVFKKDSGSSITENDQNKNGAIFKLYILSCAYFTGLQKKTTESTTHSTTSNNPKTIREILYWLSALSYSPAYPKILKHGKKRLEEVLEHAMDKKLKFIQTGLKHPITVDEFNLFAHFQAVTQYCPLVLIGIQGGLGKSTDSTKEPAIHALYANTACGFTYPTVDIQAYNQVVHYIRGLFYQLYFLRKQCAVKVTCGGKWRECRYGNGVVSKGVISWMCLGCDPMEHDRKCRVKEMGNKLNKLPLGSNGSDAGKLKDVLEKIGDVVVQLGNAQEVLEKDIGNVNVAVTALKKVTGVKNGGDLKGVLEAVLKVVETKVKELETEVGKKDDGETSQAISKATKALEEAKSTVQSDGDKKNEINAAHHGLQKVLEILKMWLKGTSSSLDDHKNALLDATSKLKDICNTPKCPTCKDHKDKCGQQGVKMMCDKCHQQYMDGTPSPLQAFLEDRLPGFSCEKVLYTDQPDYPPAADHSQHCGGSGQCCPLPMGFRNQFQDGVTHTGQRLYGILYFFSNENMMQSCVYTLVRVTAELSATTPQVLGDVFGFFRGGVGNPVQKEGEKNKQCNHTEDPKTSTGNDKYFCGWCASGLRDEVKKIEWIKKGKESDGGQYRSTVGEALIEIKGERDAVSAYSDATATTNTSLSRLTENCQYLSPLTGELYTAVSATFGSTYLSWVLYLSDALEGGLQSLSDAFRNIECRGCRECDPNKCKKGAHGQGSGLCQCQSIVSCTGVLPVLYRHGFSYGNPFNLEGYQQGDKDNGDYSITEKGEKTVKRCHQFLDSINAVIKRKEEASQQQDQHPLTELLKQVGQLQYNIRLPWIFVLTLAWLVAVLYLAFGAMWPLDWTHMRSHWLRGGEHQWQCMWYKVMTGRKGVELVEYFGRKEVKKDNRTLRTVLLSGAKGWGGG